MSNRCRRCNRKLKDQDALFGWRCAEILGISEAMSMVNYETFLKFTESIKYADSLFKNSNLNFSDSQMKEIYSIVAKMFLWDGIDEDIVKETKKKLYSIVDGAKKKGENLTNILDEYWTKTVNMAKETWDTTSEFAKSVADNVKNTFNNTKDYVINEAEGMVNGMSKDLADISKLDDITSKGLALYDKLSNTTDKVIDENGKLIENSKNERGVKNYKYNKEIDMSEYTRFINGQGNGNVSKLRFGNNTMNRNGCGVIATYNALVAMDDREDICNIAAHFESDGQILGGDWGTNIYAIGRYFEARGYDVEKVSGDNVISGEIPKADSYVLASWNSTEVTDGMHIVAMRNSGKTGFQVFNYLNSMKNSKIYSELSTYLEEFKVQPVLMIAINKKK